MFERLFGTQAPSTLIEAAFRDISGMIEQASGMYDHALGALLENKPLEVDLDAMDDAIDNSERMVRRSVLEHLTINPTQDLVASLVLVSMVQDAERIGDFALGLGELVPLAQQSREGVFRDELASIAADVRPLFALGRQGFRDDDVEKSREVITGHLQNKLNLQAYTERVAASDLTADMAVVYASAARILRRISAHLSNIASSVVQPYDQIRHGDEDV